MLIQLDFHFLQTEPKSDGRVRPAFPPGKTQFKVAIRIHEDIVCVDRHLLPQLQCSLKEIKPRERMKFLPQKRSGLSASSYSMFDS